ncbi:MAG: exosortase family protein XrtF [Bacteroidetes bacterium]|nr:exosortase family protein XrtF [Bacteroidota bacterium]
MLQKYIKDQRQRAIAWFIIKALLLYITWFISYDFFIAPAGKVDAALNYRVATDAGIILDLLGYDGGTQPGDRQTIVCIKNETMVGVGNPCNGLELFVLFAGFIICFPGSWKNKWWYILIGSLIIHFFNVMRTVSLALIQFKAPEYLDFNHHYTFTIVVYSIIFFLWIFWTNRYSSLNELLNSDNDASKTS